MAHHKDNEALWWAFISITTTVGYGDYYPVTAIGHIIAIMMIATGVGLFTTCTSYLATIFLLNARREHVTNHIRKEMQRTQHELHTMKNDMIEIKRLLAEQAHTQQVSQQREAPHAPLSLSQPVQFTSSPKRYL